MALIKATIQSDIKAAFTAVMNQEQGRDDALDTLAGKLADALISAVQSADIIYTAGLTAPPMGGPVTGKFEGSLK